MGRKLKQSKKKKVKLKGNRAKILRFIGILSIGGNAVEEENKLYTS
jgi:hypothetical protein